MPKRKSSGQAGPSRGNNKPRLTSSSVADVESSDKSLKKEAEEKRKERFNKYTTRKWNSLDKGGASTSSDVNQTGGNSKVDKDRKIADDRRIIDEKNRTIEDERREADEQKRGRQEAERKLEIIEREKKEKLEESEKCWEIIRDFEKLDKNTRCIINGIDVKDKSLQWWDNTLCDHREDKEFMDPNLLSNYLNHKPFCFDDIPKGDKLRSTGTKNIILTGVVSPRFICRNTSDEIMADRYKSSIQCLVALNKEHNFQDKMMKIISAISEETFESKSAVEDSKESIYAHRAKYFVYDKGPLLFRSFYPYRKKNSADNLSFKKKLLTETFDIPLYPDLKVFKVSYIPKVAGISSDSKDAGQEEKVVSLMVGEVKKPSIQPVLEQLKRWAAKGTEVLLNINEPAEADEGVNSRNIISQLLCYMIIAMSRNGVLTDSKTYIYVSLEAAPEAVVDSAERPNFVLSFYEAPANTAYKEETLPLSPIAAWLGIISSSLSPDLETYDRETTRMFSTLTSWAQDRFINEILNEEAGNKYYDHFCKAKTHPKKNVGSESNVGSKSKLAESSIKDKPLDGNIKVDLLFEDKHVLYHGENFNSVVIQIPYDNLPKLLKQLCRNGSNRPDHVAAKVFDVAFLYAVRSRESLSTLQECMFKLYSTEVYIYRKILKFNNANGNPINIPAIYGNGFISIWDKDTTGSKVDHHVAVGPAILMETLQKERPSNNEQFEAGLSQLAWLHTANIAHKDIRIDNMFYTGGRFIFIDFGESVKIPYSKPQGSPSSPSEASVGQGSLQTIEFTEISEISTDSLNEYADNDLNCFIKVWHEMVKQGAMSEDVIKAKYLRFAEEYEQVAIV